MITETVQDHLHNCPDLRRAKLYITADDFGITQKVLYNMLKAEGTSYVDLLDAERKRRCEILMSSAPKVSQSDIASTLGYGSPDSVTRAFKRWFGMPLQDYRVVARYQLGAV